MINFFRQQATAALSRISDIKALIGSYDCADKGNQYRNLDTAEGHTMYTYRPLTADDASCWKELYTIGAQDFPLGFLMTPAEVDDLSLEKCRSVLDAGGMRGVFSHDALVGFCGFRRFMPSRVRHRGEIGPFFVKREFQGAGAAQALMAGVLAEAKDAGIKQLELGVAQQNHRAIAFYERRGFKRYGEHPDAVRDDGGEAAAFYTACSFLSDRFVPHSRR